MKKRTTATKKLLSLVLCIAMLLTVMPMPIVAEAVEAAKATKATKAAQSEERTLYKINNLDDLKAFRDLVNSGETDVDAYLTSDINLKGEAWTPIGRADMPYTGHFDGRGRTISNLLVTGEYTNDSAAAGFFGYIKGAGIRNLKVTGTNNASTITENATIVGRGLVVGVMVDSILYNCVADGEVTGSGHCAGGLVGGARHSIIIDCGSTATVNSSDTFIGGLAGYMTAGYEQPLCLLNSYCTGNVTHTGSMGYAGGLVGSLIDDAVNNVFTGTITSNNTNGGFGALFGYVGNDIQADPVNTTTTTFVPVIERNYYQGEVQPIGVLDADLDATNYTAVYTGSTLKATMNDGLDAVNQIIDGHRGYLSTTQWAKLVAALDGESVVATEWISKNGVICHTMHALQGGCYCNVCKVYEHTFNSDGFCIYCKGNQPPEGTGSRSNPYLIGNLGQLYAYAKKAYDANYSYGKLTADIVINENLLSPDGTLNRNPEELRAWTPIGTKDKPFYCGFDGDGHTISGLYINSTAQYVGLFGYTENYQKKIENLGVVDSYVVGDTMVGLITGYNNGDCRNCYTANSYVRGNSYVGGIAGYVAGSVQNCINAATVEGNRLVGGIAYNIRMYDMENCLNVGTVTGNQDTYAVTSAKSYMENCYYLDTCGANGTTGTGDIAVTAEQLRSGEVAYKLGEAYGQNLDNGKEPQAYPTLGGAKVYGIVGCDGNNISGYSNNPSQSGTHSGDFDANGFCTRCGAYQPAALVDGYYQITNGGNLYWFADRVNNGGEAERTINAILLNDIDLEGNSGGTGRKWIPIGTTGGTNSQSFRGIFEGNGKTITGLYVDAQKSGLGLFGEVRCGTVRNFTVYGDVKLTGKHDYIGGVIGSACGIGEETGSVISDITSYVNVTLGEGSHGSNRVGGLLGYVNHETLVENCVWYGTLDLDIYRAQDGVGGLVGKANDQYTGTIRNCAAYGTIRTAYKNGSYVNPSDNVPFDSIYVGGIVSNSVAKATTTLENCIWGGTFINETDLGETAHLSAVGTMNGFANIANCYVLNNAPYITTLSAHDSYFTLITRDQLVSGEIAYTMNALENGSVWGQTIDGSSVPIPGGDKVYYGYLSCTSTKMEYANDSTVDAAKDNHTREPVYRDNNDGTHTQIYNCCGTEFANIPHSFNKNSCVCGAFGGHWGENCMWTLKDDVLEFYGTGVMQDRDGYDGYPWLNYDDTVTAVAVHEGITHICDSAFAYMGKLTSVTLPDSLISAGAGVFSGCGALESIRLPASLKHIPKSMLSLTGLRTVTIPEGVLSIGEATFANCSNLTEVHLPQSLESIERFAFGWSQNLDALDLSASVNFVGDEAFAGTFARITVDPENPVFSTDADGSLYNKDKTTLYYCAVETGIYTVAATVTEVGPYAFEDVKCEQIILPEGLKTIGERAFQYVWITQITIPSTVETIADDAFRYATYLKTADVHCSWDDEKPLYDFDNDVEVRKVLHGPFDAESGLCRCGVPNPAFAAAVSKNGVVLQAYATISEAFAAVSTATAADRAVVILLQDYDTSSISAPTSGTYTLDLNGHAINLKAQSLSVIDSSATENTVGTGSLITNGVVARDHTANGMRYIALCNDGVYTFHRVTFAVSKVSLRASAAGLYYTATLVCDPVLRESIACSGVALSTLYMPGTDFERSEDVLYTCNLGAPWADTMTSCAVFDIFKEDAGDNAERGKTQIYTNAYFRLTDGTTIMAYDNAEQWVSTSLYDVLAALNDTYMQLDSAAQDTLFYFAIRWRDVITEYGFENLLSDHIPEEP